MGIIIWLIVGGICGWLASLIMRTDAQQGIILNIIVGIVGAAIAGFLLGGGIAQQRNHGRELPLFAARRGRPSGDRQPRPPGLRPLSATRFETEEAARHRLRGLFLIAVQRHRQS